MTANQKLDPTKFRKHYFSRSRIPDWQQSFEKIRFGVEIEYVIHAKEDARQLMGREDYFKFVNTLLGKGYSRKYDLQKIGRISRNNDKGFVKINPDFAYHILEFSLPPLHSFNELADDYIQTLNDVDSSLTELGFCRGTASYIDFSDKFELVTEQRLTGSVETFQSHVQINEFSNPWMAGQISSTHVHFNIGTEKGLKLLPALYETEWIALKLFSSPNYINGREVPSARTLLYEHTFGNDYPLVNIPDTVPTSVEDYVNLFNCSKPLFPNDKFFPARDFSIIRPTPYGTLEFRSADTTRTLSELYELLVFRLMQLKYAKELYACNPSKNPSSAERFLQFAKESRTPLNPTEQEILAHLIHIDTRDFDTIYVDQSITEKIKNKLTEIAMNNASPVHR